MKAIYLDEAIEAVNAETEFPDEMPDEMFAAIANDKVAITHLLRLAVRETKKNTIARLNGLIRWDV